MRQCIREEVKYIIKSKYIFCFVLINIMLCISVLYSNYLQSESAIEEFYCCAESIEKNISVGFTEMDGTTYIVENQEDLNVIKNRAESVIYSISPEYIVEFSLVVLCSMALLIMALMGAIIAGFDNKCKTSRIKFTRHKRRDIFIAKQLTMIGTTGIITVISLIIVYIGNFVYYEYFMKENDYDNVLKIANITSKSNWCVKIMVAALILLFCVEVGFCIGSVIKNSIISCVAIIVYSLFVPAIEDFDPKCCMGQLLSNNFNIYGSIEITELSGAGNIVCGVVLLVLTLIIVGVNYMIYKYKSAY